MTKRAASVSYDERNTKRARETPSPLYDRRVWMIFETFLTSTSSYGDVLAKVRGYLGEEFVESEWSEATTALFSGDEDNELSLANFRIVKAKYLTDGRATSSTLATERDSDVNCDAEEVVEVEEDELEVEETVPEASTSRLPPIPHKDVPALQDPAAWEILERFLTTDTTYGQTEDDFHKYLGSRHRLLDWTEARLALFSGDGDEEVALANFLKLKHQHLFPPSTSKSSAPRSRPVKNPFIDLEAEEDDEEDEEEEEYRPATVTRLPARRHDLSEAIARIEVNATSSSTNHVSSVAPRRTTGVIPKRRMYKFILHVPARQFIADYLEKRGFSIVISPWIPSHLYITSDSPRTILKAIPDAYSRSVRRWDVVTEEQEAQINALSLQFPHLCWLRVKRGKYRDAVGYLFDSEQSNNFVTVLIPPRDFPYEMPKGSVALFDPSRLPPGISTTDITRDGEIVGQKYKGEEYYCGLLKKSFHRYSIELIAIPHPDDIRLHIQAGWDTPFAQKAIIAFSKLSLRAGDSVRLHTPELPGQICTVLSTDHAFGGTIDVQFELDGVVTQTRATLVDVERVFNVGDEVRVLAGVYQGVEGHLVQKYEDNFTICQAGTQQEIEVSKYYLDRRPIDRTLQAYMSAPQYVDPPEEPKIIEIGDYVTVTVGDLVGKSGLVLWAAGEFIWLHDDADLQRSDDRTDGATPFLRVQASMVERTRLPATIKFTKERGYDVKPGDAVSVARGPEFRTKGVVSAVDFLKAQLTLETDGDHSFITVPIRFVMKTRNVDLDDFKKFINKEVYIIGGDKKGFRATLYGLSPDHCVVAVHGQPRMNAKRCDVATSFGCRLSGAMLEWGEFTSFCEMRRKSHIAPPPRSITPPPERLAPVDSGPSTSWTSWSSEAVASTGPQINAVSSTGDPWVVDPSDILPAAEPTVPNPRDPLCWLREFAVQFYTYHALFHVSAGFQGGKLVKRLASSHSPDPFCGPNGMAPPGHIAAWCTAKTAGGARVDYRIPVEFLTPAQPRKKGQECFIMSGEYRGGIRTVAKCNTKNRTVDLRLLPTSNITVAVGFDDVCLVEPTRNM